MVFPGKLCFFSLRVVCVLVSPFSAQGVVWLRGTAAAQRAALGELRELMRRSSDLFESCVNYLILTCLGDFLFLPLKSLLLVGIVAFDL